MSFRTRTTHTFVNTFQLTTSGKVLTSGSASPLHKTLLSAHICIPCSSLSFPSTALISPPLQCSLCGTILITKYYLNELQTSHAMPWLRQLVTSWLFHSKSSYLMAGCAMKEVLTAGCAMEKAVTAGCATAKAVTAGCAIAQAIWHQMAVS
jgi:hypothetical protein